MKSFAQLILLVAVFMLCWFLLSQINFTGQLKLEKLTEKNENKISELLLDLLRQNNDEVKNDTINAIASVIINRICEKNNINDSIITLHIIDNKEVNALTLPAGHLVLFTGLIEYCKTPEELAGVIGHELAHMQKGHVTQKLVKEIGLSMLFVLAGGNGSMEILSQVLKTLSSKAFDRDQETEADMYAVELLSTAGISSTGLSDFLFRLSQEKESSHTDMILLSTHPGSADRASAIIKESQKHTQKIHNFEYANWEQLRKYPK
jgi:beta-barrel assembly-enhancing protease